jgi:hypothetical protein
LADTVCSLHIKPLCRILGDKNCHFLTIWVTNYPLQPPGPVF